MRTRLALCLLASLSTLCAAWPEAAASANPPSPAGPPPEVVVETRAPDPHSASGTDGRERRTGELRVTRGGGSGAGGSCPLRHTDVRASVSGFVARVTVTQEFANPFDEMIEAVYTFPLPQGAAVDDMTMRTGERTIRARIMRRAEAQELYEAARDAGRTAALLEQERPNIFTQSVANVAPGTSVRVRISYVELLKYERGSYEFVFPMTVGPRYIPGSMSGATTGGRFGRNSTHGAADASRITPRPARASTRAGHDISLEVAIDAGVPVTRLTSVLHDVQVRAEEYNRFRVRLKDSEEIPDRDFVLRYRTAGGRIESGLLAHRDEGEGRGGFFTLILQPPDRVAADEVTPKEIVFVLDTSGSMDGFPIEKAKETMRLALDGLNPEDTFNLITFAGDTSILFDAPAPATALNLVRAKLFLKSRWGAGGTQMMTAVRAALAPSDSRSHVRVVCFMTDGYVGNDFEIISEIQRHPNARVFSFGVGDSPNRFLLDKMAEAGRGEVEYVTLSDDGSAAARRFHERVRSPLLTDISIDWGGLAVAEVFPRRVPDLFDAKPVIVTGRYAHPGRGMVRLRGRLAGREYVREFALELPAARSEHDALASVWARRKIDHLMARDFAGLQSGETDASVEEEITRLGLDFRLMTQFTSFVAVEDRAAGEGGRPRRIDIPVELPSGVSPANAPGGFSPPANYYGPAGVGGGMGADMASAFTMSEMIVNIGPVSLAVFAALAIMALSTFAFAAGGLPRVTLAGFRSRRFARALTHALADEDPPAALARLARTHAGSPLATATALLRVSDESEARAPLSRGEIASAELSLRRATLLTGAELRRGLTLLSTVGSTAPLVGLLGTVFGLMAALQGMENAESAGVGAVSGGIAEALLTTALGLAVAVPAVWVFNYSTGRADRVVAEMENSSSELIEFFLRRVGAQRAVTRGD